MNFYFLAILNPGGVGNWSIIQCGPFPTETIATHFQEWLKEEGGFNKYPDNTSIKFSPIWTA